MYFPAAVTFPTCFVFSFLAFAHVLFLALGTSFNLHLSKACQLSSRLSCGAFCLLSLFCLDSHHIAQLFHSVECLISVLPLFSIIHWWSWICLSWLCGSWGQKSFHTIYIHIYLGSDMWLVMKNTMEGLKTSLHVPCKELLMPNKILLSSGRESCDLWMAFRASGMGIFTLGGNEFRGPGRV